MFHPAPESNRIMLAAGVILLAGVGLILIAAGLPADLDPAPATQVAVAPPTGPPDPPSLPRPAAQNPPAPTRPSAEPPAATSAQHGAPSPASPPQPASPSGPARPRQPASRARPPQGAPPADPPRPANPPRSGSSGQAAEVAEKLRRAARAADDEFQRRHGLTAEEERGIGAQMHRDARATMKIDGNSALARRAKQVVGAVAKGCRNARDLTYYGIRDPEFNAFTHAGGYVYVTTGLAGKANDRELECVLAHELGHQELGHCRRNAVYPARAQELYGSQAGKLASFGYYLVALGYSEDLEFEADAWGYHAMRQLGRSHQQSLAGLRLCQRLIPDPVPRRTDRPRDQVAMEIENHFRSHPPTGERLARLERLK